MEKEADMMGEKALSSNKNTTFPKSNQIFSHTQSIIQRKIVRQDREYLPHQALQELDENIINDPLSKEALSNGILPVYDKVNKEFTNQGEFCKAIKEILPIYTKIWNIENLPLKEYIKVQEDVQNIIKEKSKPFMYLLTTVGFEHEFAGMDKSPLSGVSHLEFAKSEKTMPFTGLPFILETDASDAIEMVSPPLLMPTIKGIPLPHPKKVGVVDKKMQEALYGTITQPVDTENEYAFIEQTIGELLKGIEEATDWDFELIKDIEVKPENLSANTKLDNLVEDLEIKNDKELILDATKVENYKVGKSKKVEGYHKILEKTDSYNIAPQVNFATDIATVALLEEATESEISANSKVKIYKEIEEILKQSIKEPVEGSKGISEFYRQMIRKLAGLLSVHAQEDTRKSQNNVYGNLLARVKGEKIANQEKQPEMFRLTSWHSVVKDTTSVWVKDHIVNIAYGMLTEEDFSSLIESLESVDIKQISRKLETC